jgi:hypothetical protein
VEEDGEVAKKLQPYLSMGRTHKRFGFKISAKQTKLQLCRRCRMHGSATCLQSAVH